MDIVSALIEDNINKAREINTILEGNEEQLQHIEQNITNIQQNNYYANRVLDYFNSWYTYLKPKLFKEEITVSMSIPNITITDTDIKHFGSIKTIAFQFFHIKSTIIIRLSIYVYFVYS